MKFTDVRTIKTLIKEYGMDSGAATYGSNKSVMAPNSSPSKKASPSPTTDKKSQSPVISGPAKKEQPKILAVRASDVPDDVIVKDIKDKPMGKVVSRVGDKPKADALVVDTGKPVQKQYQVLDKNQKVFIDNPKYKEESAATKLISKLKIKSKKLKSVKKILRNSTGTTGIDNMKESVFGKFDRLSLEEQLRILEKVDADKLNEAWSKKYKDSINCSKPKGFSQKAHCDGKKLKEESDYSQYENAIEDFVQSLNPDDVGVEQIGPYHIHFEGFTDECQQDAERRCNLPSDNPRHLANYDDVYKEVIRDFVRREGGKKPLKVGFAGYQDYPVIYAVFANPEPYKNPDTWNPKIDETVDAHTIYSDVQSGHREPDDFVEGDIGDRIYWFDDYKLTSLPISNLNLDEHYVDEDLVDDYIEHIKDSPKTMPPIVYDPIAKSIIDGIHRANAYANLGYDTIPAYVGLTKSSSYGEREGDNDLYEASGYIPSAKEKNDPRFKTALTVDVKPDAIKKNAKAFGFKTSRAGIPPQARADGKIAEDLMREFKTFLGEQQEEMFPGYDEQHREKRLGNWLAKSWGVQNGKPQTFYHATTKDFDTFNTHGTGFASALGMAYEVERHGSFFAVDPKFAEGFIEDPNTGRVKEGGRILPVHLSIQSPIDLRDDALSRMLSDEETVAEFKANDIDLRSIYNHFYELERWELFDGPEGAEFIDNLQKLGFDGAIINEAIPNNSNAKSGQVWVAFSPNQVKSVYNRGSFSPDDARLTKESG